MRPCEHQRDFTSECREENFINSTKECRGEENDIDSV